MRRYHVHREVDINLSKNERSRVNKARSNDSQRLSDWTEIDDRFRFGTLLVGNGFSQNVSPSFRYDSLFSYASGLTASDCRIFDLSGGQDKNFERVLSDITICKSVCSAMGIQTTRLEQCYARVRAELIEAVKRVHIPWKGTTTEQRNEIACALRHYSTVYTTNYDLLLYWAIMSVNAQGFTDLFGEGGRFDPSVADRYPNAALVAHLHGGLHLYRYPDGRTLKRKSAQPYTLIDLSSVPMTGGAVPLFVSEGESTAKMRAIRTSDYLNHAFGLFNNDNRPLVIFGSHLDKTDEHIIRAISNDKDRSVAISIRGSKPRRSIDKLKRHYRDTLDRDDLIFFKAETHPLGSGSLAAKR